MLLSAGYAGLLLLVFSSDFSKTHSFLLLESTHQPKAKAIEKPNDARGDGLADRISSLRVQAHVAVKGFASAAEVSQDGQSPESAAANHP